MATKFQQMLIALAAAAAALPAQAQSFRVQCPVATPLHPGICSGGTSPGAQCTSDADCPGAGTCAWNPASTAPGKIKCQHIGGGDGYATMGDGTQIYLFAFSPLSGLKDIEAAAPGTQTADVFNLGYHGPNYSSLGTGAANYAATPDNGAVTEPAGIMDMGVLAGNAPAPLMAIDEDDEFFLTLSNPGMIMRPDLFEQHTVHFHGYPNASSFFDGVPDASIAINIAGSFTYYYTAPDAGTYFWHCHITPPEHLQMGMVGQLYVRPRQNRVPATASVYSALLAANQKAAVSNTAASQGGTRCTDILCTGQTPAPAANAVPGGGKYAYNDGDGSTRFDVEVPIQMMGFDPNFHYVGMTFNPESFFDMKDKYLLLNGRGYPDTVGGAVDPVTKAVVPGAMSTLSSDGVSRPSQPIPAVIVISKSAGQTRALVRLSMLSVTEHVTIGTIGVPMHVIALNARLLRDMAGGDTTYLANSITLGGGESADVILDVSDTRYAPGQTFYLYSTNLDHLSNDAENFGGMMTEIRIN
jgi:FtsP/CotA-like multicopper oxidase with cupredoxin domain